MRNFTTTLLANLFLLAASFANMLALYWYGFGLWPLSWKAFLACFGVSMLLLLAHQSVRDE